MDQVCKLTRFFLFIGWVSSSPCAWWAYFHSSLWFPCLRGWVQRGFSFRGVCVCVQKNDLTLPWSPWCLQGAKRCVTWVVLWICWVCLFFYSRVIPILFCCSGRRQLCSLLIMKLRPPSPVWFCLETFFLFGLDSWSSSTCDLIVSLTAVLVCV